MNIEMNISSRGGYDYEPVSDVSKDLSCVICFKLMRNPVQFNCGHGMCSSCYKDLVENTERSVDATAWLFYYGSAS